MRSRPFFIFFSSQSTPNILAISLGGWQESNAHDTSAFNLQTPSLFIDLRIPTSRPHLSSRFTSLDQCDALTLRILARQHCFAGYTRPEYIQRYTPKRVFTRHHVRPVHIPSTPFSLLTLRSSRLSLCSTVYRLESSCFFPSSTSKPLVDRGLP